MAFGKKRPTAKKSSLKEILKECKLTPTIRNEIITYIEMVFVQKGVLSSYLEAVADYTVKGRIHRQQLELWFSKYSRSTDIAIEDIPNVFNSFGLDAVINIENIKDFYATLVLSYRNKSEQSFEKPCFKNEKSPSRKEAIKWLEYERKKTDIVLDRYANDMSKKIVHIELLESVIEQFVEGDINFKEFCDWMNTWEMAKDMDTNKDILEELGVASLGQMKKEIDKRVFAETAYKTCSIREAYLKAS